MKVIENCDDIVNESTRDFYWVEQESGEWIINYMPFGHRFCKTRRYVRIDKPPFPPRRPPKPNPEWKWVRCGVREQWAFQSPCGLWFDANGWVSQHVIVLD